jgi:hypothetical protein
VNKATNSEPTAQHVYNLRASHIVWKSSDRFSRRFNMAASIPSHGDVLSTFGLLSTILLGFVVYIVTLYVYRIWFSPISHIPGPKLAAATRWYEFYYDAILIGKYYVQIQEMHKQYGTSL